MLLKKSPVLVISKAPDGDNVKLTNDYASSFGEWFAKHPKHVVLQVVELDLALFNDIMTLAKSKPSRGINDAKLIK